MLDITRLDGPEDFKDGLTRTDFVNFLFEHLDQFGDTKEAINRSIDYAFSDAVGNGGFLLAARHEGKLVGAVVINETGMEKYIPAYILVYIAVDGTHRGKGFGGAIMERVKEECPTGGIALHVEYENPARRLYERQGFTSKYAEMRYDPEAAKNKG